MQQKDNTYKQHKPSKKLEEFVDSFWEHKNLTNEPNKITIFPDSFFKLIIEIIDGKIIAFFLTGLWPKEIEIVIPAHATVYGIKFKALAPEFVFDHEVASILKSHQELDLDFWNIGNIQFGTFAEVVEQLEAILCKQLGNCKQATGKKLQLSQLLYQVEGEITVDEVSNQIDWSTSQINRYLNKYLGVSLKTYLNIQKVYASYVHIREGRFFPEQDYYDQAHFIREVKKHTSQTPSELHKEQDARFIQIKNIRRK